MKPKRIAKPFVHKPLVTRFHRCACHKDDVVQFCIATRRPPAQINRKQLFLDLAGHDQDARRIAREKPRGKNNSKFINVIQRYISLNITHSSIRPQAAAFQVRAITANQAHSITGCGPKSVTWPTTEMIGAGYSSYALCKRCSLPLKSLRKFMGCDLHFPAQGFPSQEPRRARLLSILPQSENRRPARLALKRPR